MRLLVASLALLLALTACSEPVSAGRRTDGQEAVALAMIDALMLGDFTVLDEVMISVDDLAASHDQMSKAEKADTTGFAAAAIQLTAEDLPRKLAHAREAFAAVLARGLDAGIDWETIEYAGFSGNLMVMKDEPARMSDFSVLFTANDKKWSLFTPSLKRMRGQWKIDSFNFVLYDDSGAPNIDLDSWENDASDEDSWEVTEENESE